MEALAYPVSLDVIWIPVNWHLGVCIGNSAKVIMWWESKTSGFNVAVVNTIFFCLLGCNAKLVDLLYLSSIEHTTL